MLRAYEDTMRELCVSKQMTGCASLVFRRGQVIQAGCWGLADLETGQPFRFDTLCRLFCVTKSFVSVAVAVLVEHGLLALDDPLHKYVPAFKDIAVMPDGSDDTVKARSPILIRHLLVHAAGLEYPTDPSERVSGRKNQRQREIQCLGAAVRSGAVLELGAFVDRLARIPLACHPGEGYRYGYSFDVLGFVLEVVTGKGLDKVLKEWVFKPLGMSSTMWAVPDGQLHRLAALYSLPRTRDQLCGRRAAAETSSSVPGFARLDGLNARSSRWSLSQGVCPILSGGGFMDYSCSGLVSTVTDMAQFVQMLLRRGRVVGGERFLSRKAVAELEKNRARASWGVGKICYLGNIGSFRGGSELGMGGAARAYWSLDRKEDIATVWFTSNLDLPDWDGEMRGVDSSKADLWQLLHDAGAWRQRIEPDLRCLKRPAGRCNSSKRQGKARRMHTSSSTAVRNSS